MSKLETNTIAPSTGTTLTLGESGDTVVLGTGATQSGFGGTNTPAFSAYRTSQQNLGSAGTINKIIMNVEDYDTDNAYDTSNGRFTVPTGKGGKYHFDIVTSPFEISNNSMTYTRTQIYVNGSNELFSDIAYPSHTGTYHAGVMSADINLSAGDYVEFYSRIGATGTHYLEGGKVYGRISGHKLIT